MADNIAAWLATGERTVLACSALKESYRTILCGGKKAVAIVYLRADYDAIAGRLATRTDHFMSKDLLQSQFEALEEPRTEPANRLDQLDGSSAEAVEVLVVDATEPPAIIAAAVRQTFGL
jgi:gluconokinase